jgi:hypothetical protein
MGPFFLYNCATHPPKHTQEYLSLVEDGWEVTGLSQQDEWELCMGALLAALHAGQSSCLLSKVFGPVSINGIYYITRLYCALKSER